MTMDCEQVDASFDAQLGEAQLPEPLRRHLAICPRCEALYGQGALEEVSAELRERITRSLSASLAPVKRLAPVKVTAIRLLAVYAALAAAFLGMMGTAGATEMSIRQFATMTGILAAGAGLLALSLARQMRPGSPHRPPAPVIPAIIGLACLSAMAGLFSWLPAGVFFAEGWPCLVAGLTMAAAGGLSLGLAVRRGAPVSVRTFGATLGATAGWVGVTVLQYKCPHQQALHLLAWHGSVLVVGSAVGVAFTQTIRNLRRRSGEVV